MTRASSVSWKTRSSGPRRFWHPYGIFMGYDEIRIGGWEKQVGGTNMKPGEILAWNTAKGIGFIKKYAPDANIYTWSDMYTPFHNARPFSVKGYYYLVNGNWDGSWEGLPSDVIIMNWYAPSRDSVKWFADRGNKQVLCGYYDTKDLKANIKQWMEISEGFPGIIGMMYTTWQRNFSRCPSSSNWSRNTRPGCRALTASQESTKSRGVTTRSCGVAAHGRMREGGEMKAIVAVAAAALVVAWAGSLFAADVPEARPLKQFWTQYGSDFKDDAKFADALKFLDTCKAAGLTHLTLNEPSMNRWDLVDDAYLARVNQYRKAAEDRGITIVPSIFPIGYGIRYLVHDVNLAAGLPAQGVRFIVQDGLATPDPSQAPAVANAGFDEADGDMLAGWKQDAAGKYSFVDRAVKHSGAASLRITAGQGLPKEMGGSVRATQTLKVEPFKYYRLRMWVKTEDAKVEREDYVRITSHEGKRRNTYMNMDIQPTQDWAEAQLVFNTLDADTVEFSVGVGGYEGGTVWIDDVTVEPAGILNVVRRDMTPLTVTNADGSATYDEGRDFERVTDPEFVYEKLAAIDHAPAPIRITGDSRIKNGQTLLVSYYHAMRVYNDQVVLSLSDPALYEMMEKQMAHVAKVWPSSMYFMTADEIRIAGWELQPNGEHLTPAELLARYMQRSYDLVKKYTPGARICVWSDMFTPFHNGRPFEQSGYYYLTTGTFYGSWSGLPKDVLVANWYSPNRLNPIWFETRGNEQIMCGYYDNPDLESGIARWMDVTRCTDGVIGMMYTQWSTGHELMPQFFKLAREYPSWLKPGQAGAARVNER